MIRELADLVTMKNPLNKVNLKDAQKSIIVELIKGHCLLSVVPNFLQLKKYNVNELWAKKEEDVEADDKQESTKESTDETPSQPEEVEDETLANEES